MKRIVLRLLALAMLSGSLGYFGLFAGNTVKAYSECELSCYDSYAYCIGDCQSETCFWRCEARLNRCLAHCPPY